MGVQVSNKSIILTDADGVRYVLTISKRGKVKAMKEIPDGQDIARVNYEENKGILEEAWSAGLTERAVEIAGGVPSQANIDQATAEFQDYAELKEAAIQAFKMGKKATLQNIWADPIDNTFSQGVIDLVTPILSQPI